MRLLVKTVLGLAVLLTLGACAGMGRECPPGSHEGPYGRHCVSNER